MISQKSQILMQKFKQISIIHHDISSIFYDQNLRMFKLKIFKYVF